MRFGLLRFCMIVLLLCVANDVGASSCPAGFVAIRVPSISVVDTCPAGTMSVGGTTSCDGEYLPGVCWFVGQLRELCGAGVTQLNVSGGLNFPLYSTRATTPSLCVGYNNTTCYVDLESGAATDAINIKYNGVVYHTIK